MFRPRPACCLAALLCACASIAAPPNGDESVTAKPAFHKAIDRPSLVDLQRARARRTLIAAQDAMARTGLDPAVEASALAAGTNGLTKTGTDKVLVILVEFDPDHPDTFTWTPGVSTWDPFGQCNSAEFTGNSADVGNAAASSKLASVHNITAPTQFTYSGPLHNQIPAPTRSDTYIWTPDFNNQWYSDLIFGNGVKFQYTRPDGSTINEDLTGYSVRKYYEDLSGGQYHIAGTVVGWLKLPHSVYWYGADPCPGSRSGIRTDADGGIPGAGSARSLVIDAVEAVKQAYPNFDWRSYDQNGDGVIDRLWIIHAGVGEEDTTALLNATSYGEGGIWSHSSSVSPYYKVYTDTSGSISVGPYITMPENCGVSVLAHEFAHNLGAEDLYAYNLGNPSAGYWTVMCNSWTGYPNGFLPTSMDPWHLDNWGWLNPIVASDVNRVYKFKLGQASSFPGGDGVYRGARIALQDGRSPLPVQPTGAYQWWGGNQDLTSGMMTLRSPLAIPAAGATLTMQMAWDVEEGWDFVWVQASTNGSTWTTLTNSHTTSSHNSGWIGGYYGFPNDLAAAGIGGFSGTSSAWPSYSPETFDLSAFAGKSIYLRLWYMTDWGTTGAGPFVNSVTVTSGSSTLLNDTANATTPLWNFVAPWGVNDGAQRFNHNYYLQWRNASSTGGYDRGLADTRWYLAPVNSGLLVWYNNNFYSDNEVANHLTDFPTFGPKGRMLVVDAHPDPYRWPSYAATYPNEAANLSSYGMMRDAPFSLNPAADFTYNGIPFTGRPAVPEFHDSQSYYPGAEYVSLGSGYNPAVSMWCTRQWDASAVLPGTQAYPMGAPGYRATDALAWCLHPAGSGTVYGNVFGGLGTDGGTGNPGDTGVAYGWNVKVLADTPSVGTVVVWNTAAPPVSAVLDRFTRPVSGPLSVAAPGLLANDGGPIDWATVSSAELVSQAAHGTAVVNANGSFTYTPNSGYSGGDSFTYRVRTDYGAASTAATVMILQRGDANGDGFVNVADARLVLKAAAGMQDASQPSMSFSSADANGDGCLDARDGVAIMRTIAGK